MSGPAMPIGDAALEIITPSKGVTFALLKQRLRERGYQTDGEFGWEFTPNMVLWTGMSDPLATALEDLLGSGAIHFHVLTTGFEVFVMYAQDGGMLDLPLVKRPPAAGYKRPHWLPVLLRAGAGCGAKNCLGKLEQAS